MFAFDPGISPFTEARVAGPYAMTAVRTARELGADMTRLGAACGIGNLDANLTEDISVEQYLSLMLEAERQLGDPFFGLHVGERFRVLDAAGYGLVLTTCPDFRAVIEQTVRFESLSHDLGRSELLVEGDVAYYRWHSPCPGHPGNRHVVEMVSALSRTLTTWLSGMTLNVNCFSFTHAAPAGGATSEYQRVLKAPTTFDAEFNEGSFPAALLSFPIRNADTDLFAVVAQAAEQRLEAQRYSRFPPIVAEVREQIRRHLKKGHADLATIAGGADLTVRTLQRKLADANVSFSSLLDGVRREMAMTYLQKRDLSLTDVAFLLGYSEQSAFNHAFRGWFGLSPNAWRKASRAGAS